MGSMEGDWRSIQFNDPDYSEIPWSGNTQINEWTKEQWEFAQKIGWKMIAAAGDAAGDLLSDLQKWMKSDGTSDSLAFLADYTAKLLFNPVVSYAYNHAVGWISDTCPLVIDMDNDGIELIALADSTAHFDLVVDGFAERTAWVQADDALLARDMNGNGRIDNVNELFGGGGQSGFTALAALDTNGDNKIDASDTTFASLLLWRDANGDGRSVSTELTSLSASGIASINVLATSVNEVNAGNQVKNRSSITRSDGTTGRIDDVWLQGNLQHTQDLQADTWVPSARSLSLPLLANYGKVQALGRAMDERPALATKAEALKATILSGDIVQFRADFESFVMDWYQVAPNATLRAGVRSDHVSVLNTLCGADYPGTPTGFGADGMESEYQHALDQMAGKFLAQISSRDASTMEGGSAISSIVLAFSDLSFSMREDRLVGSLNDVAMAIGKAALPATIEHAAMALRLLVQNLPEGHADRILIANAAAQNAHSVSVSDIELLKGFALSNTISRYGEPNEFIAHGQFVFGTASSDSIYGDRGDDYIMAGKGNDTVYGGVGDDTYIYRQGDGNDKYHVDYGNDRLVLDHSYSSTSFSVSSDRSTIKMTFIDGSYILIDSALVSQGRSSLTTTFAGGFMLSPYALTMEVQKSTSGNNVMHGRWDNDTMNGGDGDDIIYGNAGADTLIGGAGDDVITADASDVIVEGGGRASTSSSSKTTPERSILTWIPAASTLPSGSASGRVSSMSLAGKWAEPSPEHPVRTR